MNQELKLIVGLGNPGEKYSTTRHNIGFNVVDSYAESVNVSFKGFQTCTFVSQKIQTHDNSLILVKPITYMNKSGYAVRKLIDYYKIQTNNVLIIVDDVNLPLGKMRFRSKGSAGGHNGLKSIIEHLGTQDFARLRLGVGSEKNKNLEHFVLSDFSKMEKPVAHDLIIKAMNAIDTWLQHDAYKAMNIINRQ
ncbi:aminoacyl-tRNA hydrolase [bacterium]